MDNKTKLLKKIISRIEINDNGCWVFTGSDNGVGYCQINTSTYGIKGMQLVHRLMWVACNGPVPDELVVDHICCNRRCVNPAHLRLLTRGQNILTDTSQSLQALNARKTHCIHGHSLDDAFIYTYLRNGKEYKTRRCKTCYEIKKLNNRKCA